MKNYCSKYSNNDGKCGLKEKYPNGVDSKGRICWYYMRPLEKLKGLKKKEV